MIYYDEQKLWRKMVLEHSQFGLYVARRVIERLNLNRDCVHNMTSDIYSYNSTIASNLKERLNE